ncbi:Nicotinamidase-related amidase [Neptunomonas antarctica]|uniref:Nicotinamidase-related amidase n=2 Tax=Neptunomonas antarctica TaxID=619304 RepID=A0A1N7MX45_9GAMM|nr:Nicotinamidase-related amidase [Neptunomonas antarctica]
MFESKNPALIIVDVQDAIDCFSDHERNNVNAEEIMATMLASWRSSGLSVVHVRHSSTSESSPYHSSSEHFSFKSQVLPATTEHVVTKRENCAFIDTDLKQFLSEHGVSELVVCGVLTNNSIDATVRIARALGFKVFVPHDATAAFALDLLNGKHLSADDVHWTFLSNLDNEYCTVCSSSEVLSCV